MSGILRLESLTKGNTLKQGDKTPLKYRLFDADGEELNIAGKSAQVRLVYPDFLTIGYEKDGLTVAQDDTVTFTIDSVIPSRIYHVEIIVDDKFIFPSRADESKFTVDKSSLGTEMNIIEIVGVEAVTRKATSMMKQDEEFIDDITENVISDSKVQSFAQGIDAKVTNALNISESSDTLSKSVQEQFNQVVINGDSSVEAAQARVDASGQTNPTLKARLDKEHNEVTAQLAQTPIRFEQTDFVELLKRYNTFDKMQIFKDGDPHSLEVSVFNDNKHITWRFANTLTDDYSVQHFVWTGDYEKTVQPVLRMEYDDITTSGTWTNSTSSVNGYTAQIGATFEAEVYVANEGDSIVLTTHLNTRGGVFKVVLDDNEDTTVLVSTYGTSGKGSTAIGENMSKGIHKVKGEFIGDDPDNPPSTSPSRGWLNSLGNPVIEVGEPFAKVSKDIQLNSVSNKDFAYNFRPVNGSEHLFVPSHGTRTSHFVEPIIYKDGSTLIDVENMENRTYKRIKSLCVSQHIYARHPENPSNDMLEIWTNQTITKDGLLQVDGKMKVLVDTDIAGSYVMMGVAKGDLFDKILTSFGNQYLNTPEMIGGNSTYIPERDWAKSYAFLSSDEKDIAIGYRFNNIRDTLRQAETDKNSNPMEMTYIQHRSADVVKIYSRLWASAVVPAGYVHKFSGDYVYALGHNLHDVMTV